MKRLVAPLCALLVAFGAPCAQVLAAPTADPQLERYIREALTSNPAMEASVQSLLAQRLRADATRAQRLPSLGVEARFTRAFGGRVIEFPTGDLFNPVYATLNQLLQEQGQQPAFPTNLENREIPFLRPQEQETKLTLRAPLFAPELTAAIAARAAQSDSAQARLEATARMLVREVKRAYYGAAQAEAAEGILEASLGLLQEDLRIARVMQREGSATRDRVLRARAEMLAVEQRLDAARAETRQARRQLARLLDRKAPDTLLLPDAERYTDGDLAASGARMRDGTASVQGRPELRELDAGIRAARAQAEAEAAQLLPEVLLAGDYGIQGENYGIEDDSEFGTLSVVMRWNLFDFGVRRDTRDAAQAEAARLRAERRDLERQLDIALEGARDALQVSRRAVDTARARVEAAEAAFAIAERKRAEASLSQVAFIDAQRALTEARLNAVITRFALQDQRAEVEFVSASYALPALPIASAETTDATP
ncbi:MAG: TolC family protein [Algiphilus sp.]